MDPDSIIYFKVLGKETEDILNYVNFEIISADQGLTKTVEFTKTKVSVDQSFDIIVCFDYDKYDNLKDLCDQQTTH